MGSFNLKICVFPQLRKFFYYVSSFLSLYFLLFFSSQTPVEWMDVDLLDLSSLPGFSFLFAALCFFCVLGDFIDFYVTGLVFSLNYSIIPSICCLFVFVLFCFVLIIILNFQKWFLILCWLFFLMAASSCFRGLAFSLISPERFRVFSLNILYYSLFFLGWLLLFIHRYLALPCHQFSSNVWWPMAVPPCS